MIEVIKNLLGVKEPPKPPESLDEIINRYANPPGYSKPGEEIDQTETTFRRPQVNIVSRPVE